MEWLKHEWPRLVVAGLIETAIGLIALGVITVTVDNSDIRDIGIVAIWVAVILGGAAFLIVRMITTSGLLRQEDVPHIVEEALEPGPPLPEKTANLIAEPRIDTRQWAGTGEKSPTPKALFAYVIFRNDPAVRVREARAQKVTARIKISGGEGATSAFAPRPEILDNHKQRQLLPEIFGRWTAEPSPPHDRGLRAVDFEVNGDPYILDIALRYLGDRDLYAFNPNSYERHPDDKLQGSMFEVEIWLTGERIDEKWLLSLSDPSGTVFGWVGSARGKLAS